MKVLHTSDWHLGKKLFKKDRLPEQELFLDWLLERIDSEKPDILVVAGDIFDTPIPSTNALRLYFRFLKECDKRSFTSSGSLQKVIILAGNHDSGRLIESPNPFLESELFQVVGNLVGPNDPALIEGPNLRERFSTKCNIEDITYNFVTLPFFRVRELLNGLSIDEKSPYSFEELLLKTLKEWLDLLFDIEAKNILIGHHLFGSFMESGSEQTVSLSGLDSLPITLFKEWDLLTLGHIHKPQVIKKEAPLAVYCGSPIQMRFSESSNKSISIYKFTESDHVLHEKIKIPIFRNLKRITLDSINWKEELEHQISDIDTVLPAFLEVTLQLDRPIPDVATQIKELAIKKGCELISFYQITAKEKHSSKPNSFKEVKEANTEKLFNMYLSTKEIEPSEKEKLVEILKLTMEEMYHGDGQDAH